MNKIKMEVLVTIANLNDRKTILYPTDTVWGLGCDATDEKAVQKILKIKQRAESKSLIILVSSVKMLQKYIPNNIPLTVLKLLKTVKKPTSIIYANPKGLAKNVIAKNNTVAIRIPKNDFCKQLISTFGKPIVSTSANTSGAPTPKLFSEISQTVLDSVDYIVNLQQEEQNAKSSTILKVGENGEITVLRP